MKGLILLALLLSGGTMAEEYCQSASIHINGLSHHTGTGRYNETNWGIGASCEYREGRRWAADVFSDSHEYPSAQAAHEWDLVSAGPVTAGLMAGLMYRRNAMEMTGLPAFPFALPYLSVKAGHLSLNGYATPPLTKETGAVFALQARIWIR